MNKSESIKELATALAKAQAEMKNPAFDASNPHFRSKYASLAAVRDVVIPVLAKHGLSISQMPLYDIGSGCAGCETIMMHSSGEYQSSTLLLPCDKLNAHGVGSAQTYARRYSLMGFAGVVGDEDDDGNAAVGKQPAHRVGLPAEPIPPTTGAWDKVPKEKHEKLHRVASLVVDYFSEDKPEDAFTYLEECNLDNDEKTAVWTLFDSKQRAALKKIGQQKRQLVEQP
jgi:hypothetical protein